MLSAADSSRKRGAETEASGQGPAKAARSGQGPAAAAPGWVRWKDGDGNAFLVERPLRIQTLNRDLLPEFDMVLVSMCMRNHVEGNAAESDEEDVTILKVTSVHGVCICARLRAVSARII